MLTPAQIADGREQAADFFRKAGIFITEAKALN